MMGIKNTNERNTIKSINLNNLVPENRIIRKIDKAIDLSFIYDKVKDLYSPYGTESIDPVVLFKIIMIQYIFGIRSMRQTIKEIQVNIAYRWYICYGFDEQIPHFSTFGKNYKRRFEGTDIFDEIFKQILAEVTKCNFLDEENVFVDGTHIKASANNKKSISKFVEVSAKFYEKSLQEEISKDREINKKNFKF